MVFFFWLIALIHSLVMEPAKTRRPNFEHTTSLSNNASAGGWADWKTEEEIIEYAKERGFRL